ncbi:GNAT family N-acetyltransferase [Saccharopolyspora shandongensis]|uniref:GNAT family N-acetyltransferase n=1 Tax=Saccharopolyspora shandongensis TaxID=418495 RepID=UPI0033C42E06
MALKLGLAYNDILSNEPLPSGELVIDDTGLALVISVRPARRDDDAQLAQIAYETWSTDTSPLPRPARDAPFFATIEPEHVLVAATSSLGAVGFATLLPAAELSDRHAELCAHVQILRSTAVAPRLQGAGIGGILLDAVQREAMQREASRVETKILSTNPTAIRLAGAYGYREEARLVGRYQWDGRTVDDVLLALEIPHQADGFPSASLSSASLNMDSYHDIG